jgi:23S rRNA (adenine2503-C2)-methyltransferase
MPHVSASPVDLKSLTYDDAVAFATSELGEPRFRGEQIFRWVHGRRARSFEAMTDLPVRLREKLAEHASICALEVAEVQRSTDGTRKLRLVTRDGRSIETVLIPDGDKLTQCISSQVGCALDCQFCATAKLGLMRNLDAGEIADQVYRALDFLAAEEPDRRITNIVYMGMGEPLHNFAQVARSLELLTHEHGANLSHRRITVSTVGLVPGIRKLGALEVRPNLAVSLNASCDEVRDEIMPINKRFKIAELLAAVREFPLENRRRITFEYVLLAGVNDSIDDAVRLGKLLRPIRCKLNIIPFNPHPEAPYARPSADAIAAFQAEAKRQGLPTYLRTPRGDDIDAACGQLANRSRERDLVQLRA